MKCKKCGHIWDYKGKSEYYVTCPHCYSKLRIKEKEDQIKNPTLK